MTTKEAVAQARKVYEEILGPARKAYWEAVSNGQRR